MATWSDCFPAVRVFLPDVATPVLENYVRQAVIDLCRATYLWQEDLDTVVTQTGVADYDLVTPGMYQRVIAPVYVALDGNELASPNGEMPRNWRNGATGTPSMYIVQRTQTITLWPTPAKNGGGLFVRAALAPSVTATEFPDFILEDHRDLVAHLAAVPIFALPKKPWSDAGQASLHQALANDAISDLKAILNKGATTGDVVVQARAFL